MVGKLSGGMERHAATTRGFLPAGTTSRLSAPWVVLGWGILILAGWLWGTLLNDRGEEILLDAPPLYGEWDIRLGLGVVVPVALAAGMIALAPRVVRTASWKVLLGSIFLAGLAWPLALTLIDGTREISEPLLVPTQYLLAVPEVGEPGGFLTSFTEVIDRYPAHVRAHPPAMVLGLWGLDQVGLGGEWAAAWVILVVAASAGVAALVALRELAGEDNARRAAPYLVLTPAALAIATTADALFMAVGAWAVALVVLAIVREGPRSDAFGLAGGLLFGLTIFLSYGLVLLMLIPLGVAVARRRVRPLLVAAAGGSIVVLAFLAAGFWWFDGYLVTRREYFESVAMTRPYEYFLLNNLAAFALVMGPVAVVAMTRLRDRGVWLLAGGGLAAVVIADLSGMSKAEVERIWLPFLPWVLLATCALPATRGWMRSLLSVQAALAIAIGVGVETNW
jgi:methylthioxylose transferase